MTQPPPILGPEPVDEQELFLLREHVRTCVTLRMEQRAVEWDAVQARRKRDLLRSSFGEADYDWPG